MNSILYFEYLINQETLSESSLYIATSDVGFDKGLLFVKGILGLLER